MFLRRSGRRRSLSALAIPLLAIFAAGPLVLPHADLLGDLGCDPVSVPHDESQHRIGASASPDRSHPQHCGLCHLARAFCSLLPTGEAAPATLPKLERLHTTFAIPGGWSAWSLGPERAPPA